MKLKYCRIWDFLVKSCGTGEQTGKGHISGYRGLELIFLRYRTKGYRCYDPITKQINNCRDVPWTQFLKTRWIRRCLRWRNSRFGIVVLEEVVLKEVQDSAKNNVIDIDIGDEDSKLYGFDEVEQQLVNVSLSWNQKFPNTVWEAMSEEYSKVLEGSHGEKYSQFVNKGTWTLEDLPPNHKAIACKFGFLLKKYRGSLDKSKAR